MSPEQIQAVAPKCSAGWAAALVDAMNIEAITTPARASMFVAQCAHESAGFTRFVENLNYSAKGLQATWPKRFPTMSVALLYARDPERIANRVYGGRLGNGPEASGDGWRYRGRGCIQITGRANYRTVGAAIDWPLETTPEDAEHPWPGARIAGWYWRSRDCNRFADAGDFVGVTKAINGGLVGLRDRELWLYKARPIFNSQEETP